MLRKASSRRRAERISKLNSVVWKIVPSGLKVIIVPDLSEFPIISTAVTGFPFSYSCLKILPSLMITAERCAESAFTHETPTP